MALDNFEQELFDELNEYQSDLNMKEEWKELEQKLPLEKKRPRPFFWWFTGAVVVGILASGLLYFNGVQTINKTVSVNSTNIAENENKPTTTTIKTNNESVNNRESNSPNTPANVVENKNSTASESSIIEKSTRSNFNSNTNKITTPTLNTKDESTITLTNFNAQNFKRNNIVENELTITNNNSKQLPIVNSNNSANEEQSIQHKNAAAEKINVGEVKVDAQDKSTIIPEATKNNEKKVVGQTSAPTNDATQIDTTINVVQAQSDSLLYATTPFSTKHEPLWWIAAAINRDAHPEYLVDRPIDLDPVYHNYNIQLKLYRTINKHISVLSGIYAGEYYGKIKFNSNFIANREFETVLLEQHRLLNGDINDLFGENLASYNVDVDAELWQTYRSISIPIGIAIHTNIHKKWTVQNDFAVTISPFQKIKGKQIIQENNDYYIFENSNYPTVAFFGLSDQLSLNYHLNNKFSIQLQADFGIDMSSRIDPTKFIEKKFSHYGIGVGGKLRL